MSSCPTVRVAVLASGSGSNLQAIIDSVEAGTLPVEVALVLSNKKDAYALERARKHGIEDVYLDKHDYATRQEYDAQVVSILDSHNIDLVVLAGYMLLVGHEIVRKYSGRIMNIHPALLPSFPGVNGVGDALAYGVKVTGVTVHFVDEGLDTGPVILQGCVQVEDDDDEACLHQRIHKVEHKLYPEAIRLFAEGRLEIDGRKVRVRR